MRILYAVCEWGLGHATRSLPNLRRLVGAHDVVAYSDGAAPALLRGEVDSRVYFVEATPCRNIVLTHAVGEILA